MNDTARAADAASRFLAAQAARDVEAARPIAAGDFAVVSPGGRRTGLDALFERLRGAYRSLEKIAEAQDVATTGDAVVVYTHGTMVGERADGTRFEGVRFLDRITVRDGLVVTQEIWNDFGQPGVG